MKRMSDTQILDLTPEVKWIGVLDHDIVTFDVVMETKYGTTYNSYLILAEKKAIIETVKESFWEVYRDKILASVDPAEIEYIILNHTEPDHSGCLAKLLQLAPNARVVASGNAVRYLKDLMEEDFQHIIVKDGHTLDLGNMTLQFLSAPNLHWPDTIFTYLAEKKILFTCDSFGCHFCHEGVFDDRVGEFDDAFDYYFDVILRPFSKFMLKAIEKVRQLDIRIIAPGHGPVLRTHWQKYLDLSEKYSREQLKLPIRKKVFIAYVSAYQKTSLIARMIAEGILVAGDFEIEVMDIEQVSVGELEQRVMESEAIIVGSPTINQNILLPVYRLFSVINPLRDKGKIAGAFGSYGWSGESRGLIRSNLENLKLRFVGDGVFVKFSPDAADQEAARRYGEFIGMELKEYEESQD